MPVRNDLFSVTIGGGLKEDKYEIQLPENHYCCMQHFNGILFLQIRKAGVSR